MTKKCPKCGLEKSSDCFHKNKGRPLSLDCYCKGCRKIYNKPFYEKQKEKRHVYNQEYYAKNKDTLYKRYKVWKEKKKITDPYYFVLRAHKALAKQLDIPIDDFENWYKNQWMRQQAQCPICGCVIVEEHIDHDHSKKGIGALRGILCHSDNIVLGHVKDDINRLEKMIEYLENNN